jgi:hypothetical protein
MEQNARAREQEDERLAEADLPAMACPACGHGVAPESDICEQCGGWLLTGQCVFCLEPADPALPFCSSCGNGSQGSACPHCGAWSIFDFCAGCGGAVTERAAVMFDALAEDEALSAALDALRSAETKQEGSEAAQLLARRDAARTRPPVVSSWLPSVQTAQRFDASAMTTSDIAPVEQARSTRAASEAAARDALRAAQDRIFASHQEARCFFDAFKLHVQTVTRTPYAWRCTAFGVLHAGPSNCSRPADGGVWLFKEEVQDEEMVID